VRKNKRSDKKRYPNNPLRNKVQKELRKVFGDLPVVDATRSIQLWPTDKDFAVATPCDPYNCGFKRAATRMCGARAAVVFQSAAYFDHLGPDGVRRIYRYVPKTAARTGITVFDDDGVEGVIKKFGLKPTPTIAFEFAAPTRSTSRAYISNHGRKLRTGPRRVIIDSWMTQKRAREAQVTLTKTTADLDHQKERLQHLSERYSPQAPTVIETQRQIRLLKDKAQAQRERIGDLREKAVEQKAAADKIRLKEFKPKIVAGTHHQHNLNVRNGSGFFSTVRAGQQMAT